MEGGAKVRGVVTVKSAMWVEGPARSRGTAGCGDVALKEKGDGKVRQKWTEHVCLGLSFSRQMAAVMVSMCVEEACGLTCCLRG